MTPHDLFMRRFFEPRSIAVIGISGDRSKIGSAVLRDILSGGCEWVMAADVRVILKQKIWRGGIDG